ncbi:lipoprotein [Spiroplasma sp. DGKH1]|uniref:lipoprotein n=1 Tax=Spiroplasma sp. DGKH1 TaxID=3050074 RepID=UPI0034C5CC09
MKKLLTIFGAFALTATGASSVVACNKNTSTTDSNITQGPYSLDEIFPNKDLGKLEGVEIDPKNDSDYSIRYAIIYNICKKMYELNHGEKIFKKAELSPSFASLMTHYIDFLEESKEPEYMKLNVNSTQYTLHYIGEKLREEFKKNNQENYYKSFSKLADSDITVTFSIPTK